MPPSSDYDSQPTPVTSSKKSKKAKASQSAVKATQDHGTAKESGIAQAVKSSAAKMPSVPLPAPGLFAESQARSKPPTPASVSRSDTPESRLQLPNGTTVTSPLLDAISSAAFSSQPTNPSEWARNVQQLSASPNNLINLGESPPVLPSSYEEGHQGSAWNSHQSPPRHLPTSMSPPVAPRRRPLSFGDQASLKPSGMRRGSVYSPPTQPFGNPPLPHQPQAHFYGAPSLAVPFPGAGVTAGEDGYYYGFDSLVTSVGEQVEAQTVVITGYQGGLDVLAVSKNGLEKLFSVTSLRGGVYGAKILGPHFTTLYGSPLVAVVVHGPVLPANDDAVDDTPPADAPSGSTRGSPHGASPSNDHPLDAVSCFQTTVEVYSLTSKERVATLLSLPAIPLPTTILSPVFKRPPPAGNLALRSSDTALVVASGTTGEVWIYRAGFPEHGKDPAFECMGKVWTTVQYGMVSDGSPASSSVDGENPLSETQLQQPKAALISLSGRWLAYCPPAASSQRSLRASVPHIAPGTKVPGLSAFAPPHAPQVNCATDIPQGESLLNRVTREGIQEVIKGAKWVGDQGMQAFKNYWNKQPSGQPAPATPPAPLWQGQSPESNVHQFPPTHATANQSTLSADPTLVAILDLERLIDQHSTSPGATPHPLATFKTPLGCSYLSFSPNGLMLFTASNKGDVQFLWDLMRLQYSRSSLLQLPQGNSTGPHVRQVASFTRMTVARIVDVVWTAPHGERLAFVSERGTVHILELPTTALVWPPARRKTRSPVGDGTGSKSSEAASSAAGAAMTAMSSAIRSTISRPRRSSGTALSGFRATSVTAHAGQGGKAIAAGISKSFGAATGTIENLRHYGENRVHLPQGSGVPSAGCVRWLKGKRRDTIAVVGAGIVRIHQLRTRRPSVTVDRLRGSGARYLDFRLPALPRHNVAPNVTGALELDDGFDLNENGAEQATWAMTKGPTRRKPEGSESSIPQAEIESNAPYQPFHTDRRVGLAVYTTSDETHSESTSTVLHALRSSKRADPWAFGLPIAMTQLDLGFAEASDDDFSTDDHRALPASAMERVLTRADTDGESEQIVITTRRRKRAARNAVEDDLAEDEGFFEDDCEVLDFASQRV